MIMHLVDCVNYVSVPMVGYGGSAGAMVAYYDYASSWLC